MAVKIRLTRRGRKKLALYDVVVADARAPRDGKFIEKIGTYNPNTNPASINLNEDKAFQWIMNGAQPTDTVKAMLSYRGVMFKKHLQIGVNKGAITQEQADAKFEEWKKNKDAKITGKSDSVAQKKADAAKARMDAETKVKEARAEAINKKRTPPAPVVEEAPAAEATEEPTAEASAAEETAE
jgi:small subunit ribosomal protein S16